MAYYVFQNLDGKGSCVQVYKIACVGWERGRGQIWEFMFSLLVVLNLQSSGISPFNITRIILSVSLHLPRSQWKLPSRCNPTWRLFSSFEYIMWNPQYYRACSHYLGHYIDWPSHTHTNAHTHTCAHTHTHTHTTHTHTHTSRDRAVG